MNSNCRRSAYTLIEVGVVMALLGIVMVVVTALLVGMTGLEGAEFALQARMQGLLQFGNQFRADVNNTNKASISGDKENPVLTLELEKGKSIIYRFDKKDLTREGPDGKQQVVPSSKIVQVEFENKEELVSVRLVEKGRGVKSPAKNWWVRAALGADAR